MQLLWLIPALPLLGALLITFTPLRARGRAAGWLAVGLLAAAAGLALGFVGASAAVADAGDDTEFVLIAASALQTFRWAPVGDGPPLLFGLMLDPSIALMIAMVTIAATCIHVFSIGYLDHDRRQGSFFSYTLLFTAAMLTMVMASNLLLFFMAWEIMGLCSYLLIGFAYERDYADKTRITPRRAAIKAFVTTRIGDVLLLIGLVGLWAQAGTLEFGDAPGQIFDPNLLERLANTNTILGISVATGLALLVFCGTIGKSAQFPLHTWLPDAMEGPTPVSALIHAATMVAAGIFLVARTYPLFIASEALSVVAAIGAFTAFFAALAASAQFDIKKILAFSTLSQLGFMTAALGTGAWVAALFHLLTHAFFKALLFLGAGSVIHGMEHSVGHNPAKSQDIRLMGGLRHAMPITFVTYLVGALALMGIPPLSGFWSKDEILAHAFDHGHAGVGVVLLAASFLTAFYMARQLRLVFFGTFRGANAYAFGTPDDPSIHGQAVSTGGLAAPEALRSPEPPHESRTLMTAPLMVLAFFAALAGALNLPVNHWLSSYLGQYPATFNPTIAAIATLLALVGAVLGWRFYDKAFGSVDAIDPLAARAPRLFRVLGQAYGFDTLYDRGVGGLLAALMQARGWLDARIGAVVMGVGGAAALLGRLNRGVDDILINDGGDLVARATIDMGDETRRVATGKVQDYLALALVGLVALGIVFVYGARR